MPRTNGFRAFFAGVLFLALSRGFVFAHDCSTLYLEIPQGETRPFFIIPKGADEGGVSFYLIQQAPDPSIASVAPVAPFDGFSSTKTVRWDIKGLATGTTDAIFYWDYPPHGPTAKGSFTVEVNVIPQPSCCANIVQIAPANDPVNTRTGGLFAFEKRDLNLGGPLPLYFERYYDSGLTSDGNITSALGINRAHNFDMRMTTGGFASLSNFNEPGTADIVTGRGRVIHFFQANDPSFGFSTGWFLVGRQDIPYKLVQTGTTFRMADPTTQTIYDFDQNTGNLVAIEDDRGNKLTLSYTSNQLTTVTDGVRTLTFIYSGNNLAQVGDGTRNVGFTYDGSGNLKTATDADGHATTYSYNGNNFLTSGTLPLGNVPISQVIATGTVTSQTQFTGTTTFVYNPNSTVQTDPVGATTTYIYSPTGQLAGMVDAVGNTISMSSDSTGRRNSVTNRLGHATNIIYDPASGLPAQITDAGGETTTYAYLARTDSNGLTFFDIAKITHPDGSTESFLHDKFGNLTAATDVHGKKTLYTYNTHSQPLTMTNPLGGVITFTYDASNRLATVHDSDTQPDSITYDGLGRILRITHPDTTHSDFTYTNTDRYATVTDELGHAQTFVYDSNDVLVSATDPLGNAISIGYTPSEEPTNFTDRRGKTSHVGYDRRGLAVSGTDPLGHTASSFYNSLRRLTTSTDATNIATTYGFDDEGQLTSIADALNNTTTFQHSGSGRISAEIDALQHATTFSRNFLTHQSTTTDPLGRQIIETTDKAGFLVNVLRDGIPAASYSRDALGDLTQIKDPDGGVWKFAYTAMGRLKSTTDPLGKTTVYTRDARGRISNIGYPDGATVGIGYNAASLVLSATSTDGSGLTLNRDNDDRVTGGTTSTGTANSVAFVLDQNGKITKSTQHGLDWGATYDSNGRLSAVTYASGAFTVNYVYDNAGRLTGVSDTLTGGTMAFSHDTAGRLSTITRPNGITSTYTFDAADRLSRVQHGGIIDLKYALDPAGEVTSCDTTSPATPSAVPATNTFKFNKAGEIVSVSGSGAPPSAGAFAYDVRGRLIASPGFTFSWDAFSRLAGIADPVIAANAGDRTFTSDAFGDLLTRAIGPSGSPSARTRFFHNQAIARAPIVAEYDDIGNSFQRYYIYTPDGYLLYSIDAGTDAVRFYHPDRNGNILALTDSSGAVIDGYAYGPSGETLVHTGTSPQPFRWLGAYGIRSDLLGAPGSEVAASTFYQIGARWLDPAASRFILRDPAGPQLTDVRTLDPYQYAFGDPSTYIDVTGAGPIIPVRVVARYDANGKFSGFSEASPFDIPCCCCCCCCCDPCCYRRPLIEVTAQIQDARYSYGVYPWVFERTQLSAAVPLVNPNETVTAGFRSLNFIVGLYQANITGVIPPIVLPSDGNTFIGKALNAPGQSSQAGTGIDSPFGGTLDGSTSLFRPGVSYNSTFGGDENGVVTDPLGIWSIRRN